eukprot:2926517-Amphidinium_carterae.1
MASDLMALEEGDRRFRRHWFRSYAAVFKTLVCPILHMCVSMGLQDQWCKDSTQMATSSFTTLRPNHDIPTWCPHALESIL